MEGTVEDEEEIVEKREFENLAREITLEKGNEGIILLLSGSFSPIHLNHIRAMNSARIAVRQHWKSSFVLGGFFVLTHDSSLSKKMGTSKRNDSHFDFKSDAHHWKHRNNMAILGLKDYSDSNNWIAVDSGMCPLDGNIGLSRRGAILARSVNQFYGNPDPPVASVIVCGGDTLPLMSRSLREGARVVCIINRPVDFDVNLWVSSQTFSDRILVVFDEEQKDLSSTFLRSLYAENKIDEMKKHMPLSSLEYLVENGLTYSAVQRKESSTQGGGNDLSVNLCEIVSGQEHSYFPMKVISWDDINLDKDKVLGKGISSTVFKATFLTTKQEIALKIISMDTQTLTRRERALRLREQSFCRECEIFSVLQDGLNNGSLHQNVIGCFGVGSSVNLNSLFVSMELASFPFVQFLRDYNSQLPFPDPTMEGLLRGIIHGMSYLSSFGILHRDLTIKNILVSKEKSYLTAKLCDFGLSQGKDDWKVIVRGSCRHYSPESLRKRTVYTSLSDVFSFSFLIYESRHRGSPVWGSLSTQNAINNTISGLRPPIQNPDSWIPKWIDVMTRCWQHKPSERPSFQLLEHEFDDSKRSMTV